MRWSDERKQELIERWTAQRKPSMTRIARAMGTTRGAIAGASMRLGLNFPHGENKPLDADHPAAVEGRTLFTHWVHGPDDMVLKPGSYQRKLGSVVTKGKWKSFPIYSLTLEERATCPRTCEQWATCYGNNMGRSKRYRHGKSLESAIKREVNNLAQRHPRGFVIRLHVLGDFYSVDYVVMWSQLLLAHPALHVFGYTHWKRGTPIGDAVAKLRDGWWKRFAVRTSDGAEGQGPRTVVIDDKGSRGDSIICPSQLGVGRTCSNCALCWASAAKGKTIAFLRH
jgi:hypothetical protein